MPRRPILLALFVAGLTTVVLIGLVRIGGGPGSAVSSTDAPARARGGRPARAGDRGDDPRRHAVRPRRVRRQTRRHQLLGAELRPLPGRVPAPGIEGRPACRRGAHGRRGADRRSGRAGPRLRGGIWRDLAHRPWIRARRSRRPTGSPRGRRPTSWTGPGSFAPSRSASSPTRTSNAQYARIAR